MIDVRERLTERLNRAKLKLELRRASGPLVVLAIGALIGLGCWFVIVKNVGPHVYRDTREVSFAVTDAQGIVAARQEVRFRGIPAGIISKLDYEGKGELPVITVKLYKRFGPIYRDARATLRPNTAIEDMYIDILDRGTKQAGVATADEPLPPRQVVASVQVEEVLQAFNPDVRTHLATVLRDLGGGLEDRGESLRRAFVEVVPFLEVAGRLSKQLGARSRMTRRLVHDTAILTGELGRRETELRTLIREGGTTLRTLADGSQDLDAMLREFPPTLAALDTSFDAVRGVLPDLNQALVSLGPVADRVPGGLRALRRLSDHGLPAVRALRRPVRRLVPLARALRPAAFNLEEGMRLLRPQIGALDHVTRTAAGCPTAIQGFFQWTGSTTKFGDARGQGIRGDATVGFDSSGSFDDPNVGSLPSCAPGVPVEGTAGPGGDLRP